MSRNFLIIILLTAAAYANIFGNGFVIDDGYFIQDRNPNPPSQAGVFRPLRSLLYTTYFQIFGTENPTGYHLHSLVVHLMATILVTLVIWEIGKSRKMGFIGGLLFGLHPIHTESITYIAASMEMGGVVLMLLSFYLYLKNKNTLSYLFATLAFFTYEMTLTLPVLLILYEWTLGRRFFKRAIPYFLIATVYLFVRLGVANVGIARGDYLAFSFYHTQLTMAQMWVKYLWMVIWPLNLSHNQTILPGFEAFMTPYSDQRAILAQSIFDPWVLGSLGILGGLGGLGWKLRKKYPLASFCIGWFFVSLLPVAYFFPQGTAFAEKYLYVASFGFILLLSWGLGKLGKIGVIGVIGIALFYGVRTNVRNRDWRSPQTLWEHEIQIHPNSELAYYNLGIIYTQSKQKDKAIRAYQKVLELKPEFWQAKTNLDNLLK